MSAIHHLPHQLRLLAATATLAGALALTGACGNYQLALQGTATPTAGGALGVRQLPPASPQAVMVDPAALAAVQAVTAGAVPAASAAPAAAAAAAPALAQVAPARPAIGDIPAGSAAAPVLPAATATATPTARTAAAPRTATPMPSFTAPAAPRSTNGATPPRATATQAPPSPSPSPSPTPSPARPTTVQVYLPEGVSDFMYAGRSLPADQALAALAGAYDVIYFKPAGAAESIAYRPGIDSIPTLPHNTLVRIGMKKAMSFVMQLPQ